MPISRLSSFWTRTLARNNNLSFTTTTAAAPSTPFLARSAASALTRAMAAAPVHKTAHEFDKGNLDAMLTRRFFFAPAFEIYGGVAGLYDYGPTGSALQANVLDVWRKHYIIEEDMLELDTTIMTLAEVLKTSGHVDKWVARAVEELGRGVC